MSFGVSGSSSKSKSNNTLDKWSQSQIEGLLNPAKDLIGSVDTSSYGGPLGAQLDPLQLQAAQMAGANAGVGQAQIGQATGIAGGVGTYKPQNIGAGQVGDADLSKYMNPYQDQVIDAGLSKLDNFRKQALVGNSQSAGSGAWGGSRHGVADSLTNSNFIDQAGSFVSSLLQGGYDRATGLAGQDIDRTFGADQFNVNSGLQGQQLNLGAANSIAGFGQAANQLGAGDASLINSFGQQAQGTEAANNQAAYEEWLRTQGLPLELAGAYGGLLGGIPAIVDNKSKGSSVGANTSFTYSDYRLKEDFSHVVTDGNGIDWFDYTIKATGQRERGVIAQQVAAIKPQAVRVAPDGYLQVNYGAL